MKSLIDWLKNNPLTIAAAVIFIVALSIVGLTVVRGGGLRERMAEANQLKSRVDSLARQPVQLPSKDPDEPPQSFQVTINEPEIEQVKAVYDHMGKQYEAILEYVVAENQRDHETLVAGLFPQPNTTYARFQARDNYLLELQDLMNSLNPGMPPIQEDIAEELDEIQKDLIEELIPIGAEAAATSDLTEEERKRIHDEKANKLIELLVEQAQNIHIYAQSDMRQPEYPLHLAAWAFTEGYRPTMVDLWEAQMELWIQQDILTAIGMANRVNQDEILVEGADQPVPVNVMNQPVKRLLSLRVLPGYAGLHNAGLSSDATMSGGATAVHQGGTTYSAPSQLTGTADRKMPDNFFVSPTGRTSNAVYDVRHARLEAVVDFAQLPRLFQAISNVNFMTVIRYEMEDVDEYDALREGYFYGPGDAVKVTMTIETIWLRQWTASLMPKLVRQYVGIDEPTDLGGSAGGGGRPGMMMPGMMEPGMMEPGMMGPGGQR